MEFPECEMFTDQQIENWNKLLGPYVANDYRVKAALERVMDSVKNYKRIIELVDAEFLTKK